MSRMMAALAAIYRRWKYVEEDGTPAGAGASTPAGGDERARIVRAIGREEELLSDCRRQGRSAMARERESTLRSLRNRLSALDLDHRRSA